jgi:aminomethyltransferase
MNFMTAKAIGINGVDCHLARSGYTGEDGFEVRINALF